jgi:hypothetical protein
MPEELSHETSSFVLSFISMSELSMYFDIAIHILKFAV